MSAPIAPPPGAAPGSGAMYRAMLGIGLVCGLIIVLAYQITLPRIERNKAAALERAILEVLPGAATSRTYRLVEGDRFEPLAGAAGGDRVVHAGYGADGALVGLALEGSGMGYQDTIKLILGWSPAAQAVIGLQVLESKETPGLGDKILVDPAFLANFGRLDVALAPGGDALAHRVVAVKHGLKKEAWEVDGITGATISSVAVADIVQATCSYWLPRVGPRLDDFSPRAEP
jgi:electron transport complex protein RnfG